MLSRKKGKVHIYEIDFVRAITAFCVVGVHAVALTIFLNTAASGIEFQNLIAHSLHFTREMFMFVTAFVLVFVYYHKKISPAVFWLKRGLIVLIPYIFWTLFYVYVNNPFQGFLSYVKLSVRDIFTGGASFQLYYILLTLEFYLFFPLFIICMRKIAKYPWRVLSISFILQILLMYVDFRYLQHGLPSAPGFIQNILGYQNSIFILYQFFFILGAYAAIYLDEIRGFFHSRWHYILSIFLLVYALYTGYFYFSLYILKQSMTDATSVLQPSVSIYSLAVICILMLLAVKWAGHDVEAKRPHFFKVFHFLANASFGVYLVHVFILVSIINLLLPHIPGEIPIFAKVVFVWLSAYSASLLFCAIMLKIPLLGWIIGKPADLGSQLKKIQSYIRYGATNKKVYK